MYDIYRCPSDNSESPAVFERGHSFLPAANERAFELNGRDDGYDYWPQRVENELSLAASR